MNKPKSMILEKPIFQRWEDKAYRGAISGYIIPWTIVGNPIMLGVVISLAFVSLSLLFVTIPLAAMYNIYPQLWRLSPLMKMDNESGYQGHMNIAGSRDLLRQVLALPPEDQRVFPVGLYDTLARDLLSDDREKVNAGIQKTLNEIKTRNSKRAKAMMSAVPTEHIVQMLEETHQHVKIETDTLEEML